MKKIGLSLAVILAFILYSYHSRHEAAGVIVVPNQQTSSNTPPANSSQPSLSTPSPTQPQSGVQYKDGTYTGSVEDAFYGNVQVRVTIRGGKMTAVEFLQHPNDNPTSQYINAQADPYLVQEAIQAQSAQVNAVTGATDTSMAFIQSLTTALSHAS